MRKGDRVAFLCPNIPPMLEAHYAVPAAGCVLVPINTRLSAENIDYILDHSGAKMLFVDAEFRDTVEAFESSDPEIVWIEDIGESGDPYEDYLQEGSTEAPTSVLEDEV